MNNNILPDNEVVQFEDRLYANPEVSLQEQNQFIDNLRNVQNANNAEINTQTYNLGTAVPSNLGGLVGGEGYFTSRYQTPQTNAVTASLRATAQAQALNEAMGNEVAMWKQRYNRAYSEYKRRNRDNNGGGGSTGGGGNISGWDGEIVDVETNGNGGLTASGVLSLDENDFAAGGKYIVQPGSGNIIRVDDNLPINDPNYQQTFYQRADGSYGLRGSNIFPSQNTDNLFNATQTPSLRRK